MDQKNETFDECSGLRGDFLLDWPIKSGLTCAKWCNFTPHTNLFMNILDQIVAHKRIEVAEAKTQTPINELEKSIFFSSAINSLSAALTAASSTGIIAEFKRKSPSKGVINATVLPEVVTKGYAEAGAAGLSVLTDTLFFGGTFADFRAARLANPTTPLLRKDFMIDAYQVIEAKSMGADLILLIAACLLPQQIKQLGALARQLGMEVLLEVHDANELERSICDEVTIIGVNNRNLKTFETSVQTSVELFDLIPSQFIKITESGLSNADTMHHLRKVGYQGFLIGETFMKTQDPAAALRAFL